MAQHPGSQPTPMAFVQYADSLKEKIAAAEAAAAAATDERCQALVDHNGKLQQQLWEKQQQLKQQAAAIRALKALLALHGVPVPEEEEEEEEGEKEEAEEEQDLGPAPSVAPEEKKKKLAELTPRPSQAHPYVLPASRSSRPVSPRRRPTKKR